MTTVLEKFGQALDEGDPHVRKWFLVNSRLLPAVLCLMYVTLVKVVGPSIMKSRTPFQLRKIMVFYNFGLVVAYVAMILMMLWHAANPENHKYICMQGTVHDTKATYQAALVAYTCYLMKYIEFLDTIFFILRKKHHLVTNLHVVHHTTLPFMCWIMLRTEMTGFQLFPGMINCFVHVIMYSYYGLAALGPEFRQYLWWKKYLTMLQMAQFVVIFVLVAIVGPLTGCQTSKLGSVMVTIAAIVFLAFFYNYYKHTYEMPSERNKRNGHHCATNGNSKTKSS